MKKIFIAIISLIMVACFNNENKVTQDSKLTNDLQELYSFVSGLLNQTRSDGYFVPDVQMANEISSAMNKTFCENDMATTIANSGYYTESIDMSSADIYDFIQYVEANGTEEYYNLLIEFLSDEEIQLEKVINSKTLLPNEQLTLTVLLGIDYAPINEERVKACLSPYRSNIRGCELIRFAINTAETNSSAAITELNNAYDYCISTAEKNFRKCSGL